MSIAQDIPPHIYQENLFRKTIAIGLGIGEEDLLSSVRTTHRSKSCQLPIMEAAAIGSKVSIINLSNNFYFYFLAVELKEAVPAILLRPLSGYMGRIALSGHVIKDRDLMVTNFEKAYHNAERMSKFAMMLSSPLSVALVLRYLTKVCDLPHNKILDEVLYKTAYGCVDAVDFNAVRENKRVIELCGLEPDDGYCNHDIRVETPYFDKMTVDIFDLTNGRSSLHVTSEGPLLPVNLGGRLLVPITDKMREAGVDNARYKSEEARIDAKYLARLDREDPEWDEKYKNRAKLHGVYQSLPLSARDFTFNFDNPLDSIMGAVALNCLTERVVSVLED